MIPSNRNAYKNSDEWLQAVRQDDFWQTKQKRMEEAYREQGDDCLSHYREEAEKAVNEKLVQSFWCQSEYHLEETIREVWEEERISLPILKSHAIGLMTLMWIKEKERMTASETQDMQKTHKPDRKSGNAIFIDTIDEASVMNRLFSLWLYGYDHEEDAPRDGELFQLAQEWICAYKLFEQRGWLKNKSRKQFLEEVNLWIRKKKNPKIKECSEDNLKKIDSYIKKNPGAMWDENDVEGKELKDKVRLFSYIYDELRQEFTNYKYVRKDD